MEGVRGIEHRIGKLGRELGQLEGDFAESLAIASVQRHA
jgi:hypothetical protein